MSPFTQMFTAAVLIVAKPRNNPSSPSTDEWINKMWYIHIMQYYLAIKRDEVKKEKKK